MNETLTRRPDGIPDWVVPGAIVGWTTWTGETATAVVTLVDRFRISTDRPGIYWEATCFKTVAESLRSTRNFHEVIR